MKTILPIIAMLVMTSCQKDSITGNGIDTVTMQSGDGVVNYADLTTSGFEKNSHPFFQALDQHKYVFQLLGGTSGNVGDYPTSVSVMFDFSKAPNNHVGDIIMGQKTFQPGSSGNYGITDGDPIADPTFVANYGTSTYFKFSGNGDIQSFAGTLRFPKLMEITNVSNFVEPQAISRNSSFTVNYVHDKDLELPVLLQVYWAVTGPEQANYPIKSVSNLFLIDDNGSVVLKKEMFKDIPKNAQFVVVKLWRGNAVLSSQDLYFMAATARGFTVNLTD